MKVCYVIRPSFYDWIKQHPQLLDVSKDMLKEQRDIIFETIDIQELMMSASSYFENTIVMEEDTLYLEYSIKQQYSMQCFEYFVNINSEKNPFFTFMKRKFRYFFVVESE